MVGLEWLDPLGWNIPRGVFFPEAIDFRDRETFEQASPVVAVDIVVDEVRCVLVLHRSWKRNRNEYTDARRVYHFLNDDMILVSNKFSL